MRARTHAHILGMLLKGSSDPLSPEASFSINILALNAMPLKPDYILKVSSLFETNVGSFGANGGRFVERLGEGPRNRMEVASAPEGTHVKIPPCCHCGCLTCNEIIFFLGTQRDLFYFQFYTRGKICIYLYRYKDRYSCPKGGTKYYTLMVSFSERAKIR